MTHTDGYHNQKEGENNLTLFGMLECAMELGRLAKAAAEADERERGKA